MNRRSRAAILTVGTEITDGQIVDRNSAWISKRLTDAGVEVVEHRAVADDRIKIERSLRDLVMRVDSLFVTGGLGPTSDDFTRELLAKFCSRELVFDEDSWNHIETRFASRGLTAKPIQRQQCFFPRDSRILKNSAGTANAFSFDVEEGDRTVRIYALPGPPIEIATVWAEHLSSEIETLIPKADRDELLLIRTLGTGESAIAEIVETLIAGSSLRVGYRAHVPYVEVKLWYPSREKSAVTPILDAVERSLSPYIVNRGNEDLADVVISAVEKGRWLSIHDRATGGLLEERLRERWRSAEVRSSKGALSVTTDLVGVAQVTNREGFDLEIEVFEVEASKSWRLSLKKKGHDARKLEVKATPLYNFGTDRGRLYLCERVFQELASFGL